MSGALARRLVVGLAGPDLAPAEADWLIAHRPAGIILFARNVTDSKQLARLCRRLHALVPHGEIMADHEGGPVSPLAAAAGRPPATWGLGQLDDPDLTHRVCRETARRLHGLGIDRVLAPVADVLTEVRNPVIGARAFGSDPDLCARHVVAATSGYIAGGVSVCLKHWPGHGGTWCDSHLTPAQQTAEPPAGTFVSGLGAGADAVMVGHLLPVGAGIADPPVTLDPVFLDRTRRRFGAGGRPVPRLLADDVTMGALRPAMAARGAADPAGPASGLVTPDQVSLAWLEALAGAGCDQLLIRGIPWRALPVPGVPHSPASAPEEPAPAPAPAADEAPYAEVRRELWARAGTGFADPSAVLGWLDLTPGDRWEPADAGGATAAALSGPLTRMFASVVPVAGAQGSSRVLDRLLVTSHRPLPREWRPPGNLARTGRALTMGHPSLTADLTTILGTGWGVGSLFATGPEELPEGPGPDHKSF